MWRLATRNWRASPIRVGAIVLSVALGVAGLVVATSGYETARRMITNQVVSRWLGAAHLTVFPAGAHWGAMDASLARPISQLTNVERVTTRLTRRLVASVDGAESRAPRGDWEVDARGVDPVNEPHFRSWPELEGRFLREGGGGEAVIERDLARGLSVSLGDVIQLRRSRGEASLPLKVVGIFNGQRVADFQHPELFLALDELQSFTDEPGRVNAIDVKLQDASPQKLADAEAAVRKIIAAAPASQTIDVETTAGRLSLLEEADRLMRLLLTLVAFVAMLTSFFIILTTMSMSLFERRPRLGMLRCVGMTRAGLAGMLLLELAPLGVAGTLAGIAAGVPMSYLVSELKGFVAERTAFSAWGMALAAGSGLVTTFVAGFLLFVEVARVTPMTAVVTESRPARRWPLAVCGVVGVLLLLVHELLVRGEIPESWLEPIPAAAGAGSIFLGYVLIVPLLVLVLGPPLSRLVGAALRLPRLVSAEICGRSPWRATGICWMLMVGLSQIVYMSLGAESLRVIWDFPGRLPGAFIWAAEYVPADRVDRIRALPWVRDLATTTDVDCEVVVEGQDGGAQINSIIGRFWKQLTRPVFVAGDPAKLLNLVPIEFVDGDRETALRRIDEGGAVLVPTQTAHHLRIQVGDHVRIRVGSRAASFEVAGIVQSPVLDVAVTAFQATSYMQFAAASAFLGTQRDLAEKLGFDGVSMVTFEMSLPRTEAPLEFDVTTEAGGLPDPGDRDAVMESMLRWQPQLALAGKEIESLRPDFESWLAATDHPVPLSEAAEDLVRRFAAALRYVRVGGEGMSAEDRWALFRERLALLTVADLLQRPDAVIGSLRRLKEGVDRSVRLGLAAMTWTPGVLLLVAMLGVANLMMISVQIRTRQIAMLRAVGALKSQVLRLVLGEALLLGIIGAVAGVALGVHLGLSDNRLTAALSGFQPPFSLPTGTVLLAIGLTISAGLLASIAPARRAARSTIVTALHTV